jgi:hypothetical protein
MSGRDRLGLAKDRTVRDRDVEEVDLAIDGSDAPFRCEEDRRVGPLGAARDAKADRPRKDPRTVSPRHR